jgi:hypothetical protein
MARRVWLSAVAVVAVVIACGGSSGTDVTNPAGSGLCSNTNACPGAQCDPSLGCVDCTLDSQCTGNNKFCVLGTCSGCRSNTDCGAATPACWPSDRQCHPACKTAQDCTNQAPICDTISGACVQCAANKDCPSQRPLCNTQTQQCVACITNQDCGASSPKCTARGQCVQCTSNLDCGGTTPICDVQEMRCRAGCTLNSQCPQNAPICNVKANQCEQCAVNTDCPVNAPVCDQGRCAACTINSDCKNPAQPFCKDAACVQCINNKDCPANASKCQNGACVP